MTLRRPGVIRTFVMFLYVIYKPSAPRPAHRTPQPSGDRCVAFAWSVRAHRLSLIVKKRLLCVRSLSCERPAEWFRTLLPWSASRVCLRSKWLCWSQKQSSSWWRWPVMLSAKAQRLTLLLVNQLEKRTIQQGMKRRSREAARLSNSVPGLLKSCAERG